MKNTNNAYSNRDSNTEKKLKPEVENGQDWLMEIAHKMSAPGRSDLAYRALVAVLHSVRDTLSLQQVFQLSAYLPLNIRGIYFEGYDPENVKVIMYNNQLLISFRTRMGQGNGKYFEDYLDRYWDNSFSSKELVKTILDKLKTVNEVHPDLAFQAVMEVMYEKIPFEDSNVNHLTRLLDMDSILQIQG